MIVYVIQYGESNDISEVEFEALSTETIRQLSVVEVKDVLIYSKGMPNVNGVNDARMGTVDRRILCSTCARDVKTCPGHIGHIELPYPCYHIGFFDVVLKTLRSVCFLCSHLSLSDSDVAAAKLLSRKNRFAHVYGTSRQKKKCIHCKAPRPTFTRTLTSIKVDWGQATFESEGEERFCRQPFTAREAKSILECIPADHVELMGFGMSHPKNFILDVVVVPPPVARPAIMVSEGSRARGQDDLTHKLQDINKRCVEVRAYMEKNGVDVHSTERDEAIHLDADLSEKLMKLQLEVFSFMNSNVKAPKRQANRSVSAVKSVSDRLKGKEGRIRGNLMGKRVDQSARSVITPDALMDIDQVGVPLATAKSLTIPERVSPNNIEALTKRVHIGDSNIDGAEAVITGDGTVIQLEFCKTRQLIRLQYGWIVERYLKDDDYVIFNRQPSLHKMGMMGHRVKLMNGSTFRLNLCCANPYNADFDGDEMNMHVPQSTCAVSEVMALMSVPLQIISPASNKPCMGIVQDTLLGACLMTTDDTFLTKSQAMRVLGWLKYPHVELHTLLADPAVLYPTMLWTGRQIMSVLFPPTMNYQKGKIEEDGVVIVNGILLAGVLTKQTLGTSSGGIIDSLYRIHGAGIAVRFMSDIQRMVNEWLMLRGFSVGIGDCVLGRDGNDRVQERIDVALASITAIHDEGVRDDQKQLVEATTLSILSKILGNVAGIVDSEMSHDNAINAMVRAGSKGNPINISQICGCVGQQTVEGQRTCADVPSSLSTFQPMDSCVTSRGFVANSYALGLSPTEYFFHAMGGREGLVDTAVKTATTGYIQRRLVKAMEDNKVEYDGTVRNAEGCIVQFIYGGDGNDPTRVERQNVRTLDWAASELCDYMGGHEESNASWFAEATALQRLIFADRLSPQRSSVETQTLLSINIKSIVHVANRVSGVKMNREQCSAMLSLLFCEIVKSRGELPMRMHRFVLMVEFCPHRVINTHRFSVEGFRELCSSVLATIEMSQVDPGETVGAIAAQSIGEPCTQMTLNSVDWHTCMALAWTGETPPPAPCDAEIGGLVDALIEQYGDKCEVQADGVTVYLPLPAATAIALSPDEEGVMQWTELLAVTRHPPINEDGSSTLVKVTTESGREVTVTKGKSLLIEREGKLVEANGGDVHEGDRVPVVCWLPPCSRTGTCLPLRTVFTTSEIDLFLPSLVSLGGSEGDPLHLFQRAVLSLDYAFGVAVGGHLLQQDCSEPGATAGRRYSESDHHDTRVRILLDGHMDGLKGGAESIDAPPSMLSAILQRTCGSAGCATSPLRVPGFALAAPTVFVHGLLSTVVLATDKAHSNTHELWISSTSMRMRDGLALLLSRFRLRSKLVISKSVTHDSILQCQTHHQSNPRVVVDEEMFTLVLEAEDAVLCRQLVAGSRTEVCDVGRSGTAEVLNAVCLERIVSICEVSSTHEFVYDLTVASTGNMTAINGFCVRDTFHLAGIGTQLTLGVPRFKELIDLSKNIRTPSMLLRLVMPFNKSLPDAQRVAQTIIQTKLINIVQSTTFVFDPDVTHSVLSDDQLCIDIHNCLYGKPANHGRWVARMTFNKDLMKTRGIEPSDVFSLMNLHHGHRIHWVVSETNSLEWFIRMRIMCEDQAWASVAVDDPEKLILQRVHADLLEGVHICGMKRVTNAVVKEIQVSKRPGVQETQYAIETQGISLVCTAVCHAIDMTKISLNDVHEAYEVFGIETAAQVLFHEIETTISFDGTYVDHRHIMQIVDTMTFRGFVMPLSRHGINRVDQGPLMRSSFEETVDIMYDAAMFNELDSGRGVTQSVMTGQICRMGTGICSIRASHAVEKKDSVSLVHPKLCKSRRRVQLPTEVDRPVEFVNTNTWCASGTGRDHSEMQHPFVDNQTSMPQHNIFVHDACDPPYKNGTIAAQNMYGTAPVARIHDSLYVPPTP